jgi:hypothetical protein
MSNNESVVPYVDIENKQEKEDSEAISGPMTIVYEEKENKLDKMTVLEFADSELCRSGMIIRVAVEKPYYKSTLYMVVYDEYFDVRFVKLTSDCGFDFYMMNKTREDDAYRWEKDHYVEEILEAELKIKY